MKTRWPLHLPPNAETLDGSALYACAAQIPDRLGPLRFAQGCWPLAWEEGRLVALALEEPPPGDPALWLPLLADLRHVQSAHPEVRRLLGDRAFVTSRSEPGYVEPPRLDLACFMPIAQLASFTWLCWDRDLDRLRCVDEHAGPLSRHLQPEGALPLQGRPAPGTPAHHAEARGHAWAAAVHDTNPAWAAHVLAGPGPRWGLLLPFSEDDAAPRAADTAWWWTHRGPDDGSLDGAPPEHLVCGAFIGAALRREGDHARLTLSWIGDACAWRLRGDTLERLLTPHTLSETLRDQLPETTPEDLARYRYIVTRHLQPHQPTALDRANLTLTPGDLLLLTTTQTLDLLGAPHVAACLQREGLRAGIEALRLDLRTAQRRGALLALAWDAQNTHAAHPTRLHLAAPPRPDAAHHPITSTRAALTHLEPQPMFDLTPAERVEQTWTLHRALPLQHDPSAGLGRLEWLDAARQAAAETLEAPAPGDLLTLHYSLGETLRLQWDGACWQPRQQAPPEDAAPTQRGLITFPEDTPGPQLSQALQARSGTPEAVIAAAQAEGCHHLARFLELRAQHQRGELTTLLEQARARTSARVRQATRDLFPDTPSLYHQVEAAELAAHPARYHGCFIRTRAVVREQLENCRVAGAWWRRRDNAAGFSWPGVALADVKAHWRCDGRGYGHFNSWRAEAQGDATPVTLGAHLRRVDLAAVSRRAIREGIPLVVTVTARSVFTTWTWDLPDRFPVHGRVPQREGIPPWPDTPHRCELEVVIVRDGGAILPLQIQARRHVTPLEPTPLQGEPEVGTYIRARGTLTPSARYWPTWSGPGNLTVTLPALAGRAFPGWDDPAVAAWRDLLADGPREVELTAEVAWGRQLIALDLKPIQPADLQE